MSQVPTFELEGRINGLREVLAIVLEHLMVAAPSQMRDALEAHLAPLDQQEDPGAVSQPSIAVEAAAIREIRLLLEIVEARLGAENANIAAGPRPGSQHDRME